MNRRPYIFLDFDGVLNHYDYSTGQPVFDPGKSRGQAMNQFLRDIRAKLIISSNWRFGHRGNGISIPELRELAEHYLGLDYPIIGMTTLEHGPQGDYGRRGEIIMAHARRFRSPWLAFDDMGLRQVPSIHKVVTDPEKGITEDDFDTAIKRLNAQL